MNKTSLRRIGALTLLLTAVLMRAFASEPVDRFVDSRLTDRASVSVYVYDLQKARQTEGYNDTVPLIPASITKALTAATTLNTTGINYRYRTGVYTDGKVEDGVLRGNVIVIGSGDPSLNARPAPKSADFILETADALADKGITEVDGRLLFDQEVFPLPAHPASWGSGDKAKDYGAGCFGFNFENNSTGSRSVSNPAAVFETKLIKELKGRNIAVNNNVYEQGRRTLLFEHVSPTIDEIMRSCVRRSDNMYAEALLRTYALKNGLEATPAAGSAREMEYWRHRGVDMENVNVVDGSGLSRSNRLTARFLGEVLAYMSGDADYVSFFPLAGQEGTLRSFLKDTELDSYIALKTGSMNGIQCYAGYKLDYNYAPTHVVVVMINNMTAARSSVRKEVEKMLLGIFTEEIKDHGFYKRTRTINYLHAP